MNELQEALLSIYKPVAKLCRKNDLKFYALGGTLLGAIRHDGFIPWDDDMDIALPRPDYDQFIKIAREQLPEGLYVSTFNDKDEEIPRFFARVNKAGTEVVTMQGNEEVHEPIWLDVFPLDSMPTNGVFRTFHKYHLLYRRMKSQLSLYDKIAHQHRPSRPLHEKTIMKLRDVTKLGKNWDSRKIYSKTEEIVNRYDYDKEDWIVNLYGAYKFDEMFPKSWFDTVVWHSFEDTEVPCPVEYNKILTQMYGDYMQLPPKEQREKHHCLKLVTVGDD